MYARLGLFNITPDQLETVKKIAESAIPMMSQAAGCVSMNLILDEEKGHAGSITVWETKEAHDAYHAEVFPAVLEKMKALGINPPYVQEFPLYTPE